MNETLFTSFICRKMRDFTSLIIEIFIVYLGVERSKTGEKSQNTAFN